jgi:hypothetical protein
MLQLLADASTQKNLSTSLATDKLPEAARVYYRPTVDGKKSKGKGVKIGRDHLSPNSFPEIEDPEEAARRRQDTSRDDSHDSEGSMASIPSEAMVLQTETDPKGDSSKKKSRSKNSDKSKSSWSWFGGKK